MGKIWGMIAIITLLLIISSVPLVPQLATAAEGEGEPEETATCEECGVGFEAVPIEEAEPEEGTSSLVSAGPVHKVLKDPVVISQAEPVTETVNPQGWTTIFADGFEGGWPGSWGIYAFGADAYWGWDSANPCSGSYSAFCAKYGAESVIPGNNYPDYMDSWMTYGPFSLADATDAVVDYWLWLDAEDDYDVFWCAASTSGYNFYGEGWTGSTEDTWVSMSFDLTDVYILGDLCGESQVWITFGFQSDGSNPIDYYGAFVDDVVIQKDTTPAEFDLEAVEVYLSTQPGDMDKNYLVDTPTVGQDVYLHFKWNCYGSGTAPEFRLELNLDGTPYCYDDYATGESGYAYTSWCNDPWTATAGGHTLTGVLDVYDDVSESNETNNEASKSWGEPPPEAAWTFMVYSDGDNNLEESEIASFNFMELSADNTNVNVIVQLDRIPGYDSSNGDWTTTRRYKVKYDTDIDNFASYTLGVDYWELGELNMADPNTLSDFVLWAKSNYPADHYCLVPSNHGGGWKPMAEGPFVPTGIVWDDTDGDYMSTAELGSALSSITSGGSEKLDVLFIDACLMQMIEVGYQVRNYSQYLVASEYTGWGPGPYHDYIAFISPTTTASQLATAIVDYYHAWLTGTKYAHTMSAVDLSQYGLASLVDDFAQALHAGLSTYRAQIESSRFACQKFVLDSYIDLYHFAFLIDQSIADATIKNAAQAVMTGVTNAVIAEEHENGGEEEYYALDDAHGISIYFPASEGDYLYSNYNSGNLAFVADKGWDEFLAAFFGAPNNPPNAPTSPLCEGVTNPTDVTDPTPEFSWTFSDPDGSDTQGAYQILVASTSENLAANNGDMWDSGKVSSSDSNVSYAGTTLAQNQTCYWKVKTWDNHGAGGPYCNEQQFTTSSTGPGCEDSPDIEVGLANILADAARRVVVYHQWGELWTGFDTIAPPAANDLTTLEAGRGYWIYVSTDCTLNYYANVHELTGGLWYMIGWLPCP
jgi:hypothetical protein